MDDETPYTKPPTTRDMNTKPCPTCDALMRFTGLPDMSGPLYFRIYKCPNCGFVREDIKDEDPQGWG